MSSLLFICLVLLTPVVNAPENNSAVVLVENTEVMLVGLDKALCSHIDPPEFPRIDVLLLFNTPLAVCTPSHTTLAEFIESDDKTLSYSSNNTKCKLHKKKGIIEETNNSTVVSPYTAVVMVTNMFPREWNNSKKIDRLYQKVRANIHIVLFLAYINIIIRKYVYIIIL